MEGKKRLHFGVLFSHVDNQNQYQIWNGIVEYAEAMDIHLTAYVSAYVNNDNFTSNLETCFETICNNKSLDGLILLSGFIIHSVDHKKFNAYVAKIPAELPVVSVSLAIPGTTSVLVDNISGMYAAVDHLIKNHGKKHIAFVKGPDGHGEAEDRLEGYKRALEANGLPFDPRYVFPGQFSQWCGSSAVSEMFDNRGLTVGAVANSNDQNAIGVLNELKARNILVPTTVSVTGFDDDPAAEVYIPSLSTVRQDFYEIGHVSAKVLHSKINGNPTDEVNFVAPIFITRQSCGCIVKENPDEGDTDSLHAYILHNFSRLFQREMNPHEIESLAADLIDKVKASPFRKDVFLNSFNEILFAYNHLDRDLNLWDDAITSLSAGIERFPDEIESPHSLLSALISATALVHDIKRKKEITGEVELNGMRVHLRRVTSSLVLIFDINSLTEALTKSLPALSLHTALIGLYKDPIKKDAENADRAIETLIGFDGDRKFSMKHNAWNPILFSDYSTIDHFDFERERRTLLFFPLFFDDEEMGVIILPFNPQILVDAYELLRVSVSTAVKGAELVSKIQTLSITDELTGLLNRRGFFQFAYSRLLHLKRSTMSVPIVMFMDMDGLKTINDTYGHNEGDNAIMTFARILREALREEDIIGRVGGDEFVVLSSVKAEEQGDHVVRRIRAKFEEYNAQGLHPYDVACSIGCIALEEATKECFSAAMLNADNVLYEEKMRKKKLGLSRR
ncbi:MAG: GGDEF domain-containing protein [Defluviitaleaceae bacterium]|nr:GGDEF domain-containing protein [Defluviitaleaceae bacterium]